MARLLRTIGAHVALLSRFTEDRFGVSVQFHHDFYSMEGWIAAVEWDPTPKPRPGYHRYRKGARLVFSRPVRRECSYRHAITLTFRSPVRFDKRGF